MSLTLQDFAQRGAVVIQLCAFVATQKRELQPDDAVTRSEAGTFIGSDGWLNLVIGTGSLGNRPGKFLTPEGVDAGGDRYDFCLGLR